MASLHSLPFNSIIKPSPKLISETNPSLYKDTNFAAFLEYLKSCDSTNKSFLETRRLTWKKKWNRTLPDKFDFIWIFIEKKEEVIHPSL